MISALLPTKRTIQKFWRDGVLAVVAAFLLWLSGNMDVLNLSPELAPFALVVVMGVYRVIRAMRGLEPTA